MWCSFFFFKGKDEEHRVSVLHFKVLSSIFLSKPLNTFMLSSGWLASYSRSVREVPASTILFYFTVIIVMLDQKRSQFGPNIPESPKLFGPTFLIPVFLFCSIQKNQRIWPNSSRNFVQIKKKKNVV